MHILCLPLLLLLSAISLAAGPDLGKPAVDAPLAGWRDSRLDGESERYVAAYPKPPVDRGAQKYRTLIRGKLSSQGKQRRPHSLVVNGTAMPLYTDDEGNYARPWAFGSGSNSIELRSPEGAGKRVQFYEASTGRPQARLRIIMTWDDPKAEVDLHILSPDGEHAFWANPLLRAGGGLDVDSVDGAGPEIFSSAAPAAGAWLLYVNYWGNFDAAGYNFDAARHVQEVVTCSVSIIRNENSPDEQRESYIVPLRKVGELTFIRRLRL